VFADRSLFVISTDSDILIQIGKSRKRRDRCLLVSCAETPDIPLCADRSLVIPCKKRDICLCRCHSYTTLLLKGQRSRNERHAVFPFRYEQIVRTSFLSLKEKIT